MSLSGPSFLVGGARALVLFLACLVLSGCASPSLVGVLREDPLRPGSYTRHGPASIAGAVAITRGAGAVDATVPAMLQPGDVVETGPYAAALIRYPDGSEVVMDTNTRVRVGSLFVEFGRILARVRGLFEVDTENVVTGVEGTEYVLRVARNRAVTVLVFDGAVVCRSKTGSWSPVRVRRGEVLVSDYPNRATPVARAASREEWDEARRWVERLDGATGEPAGSETAASGFCCDEGKVWRASPDACAGFFSRSEKEALRRCEQAQTGYCCTDGEVDRTTRGRCTGRFFLDRDAAYEECRGPVERGGYCCDRGKIFEGSRDECERVRGEYFATRAQAQRDCRPPPERGYCCQRGDVFASSRERCEEGRGLFYEDRREAERACTPRSETGYCCSEGKVFPSGRDRCERAGGYFHEERSEAERGCAPRSEAGYCCDEGKVFASARNRCERAGGNFHEQRREAERACAPRAESGYCCDRGKVFASTRDRCERAKGRFYDDRKQAERSCRVRRPEPDRRIDEGMRPAPDLR